MSNLLVQNIKHTNNTTAQTIDTSGRTTVSIMNNDSTNRSDGGAVIQNLVQGLCKAWVRFNGEGTIAIDDSFNMASLTDNDLGYYTTTYTNAFSNDDQSITICSDRDSNNHRLTHHFLSSATTQNLVYLVNKDNSNADSDKIAETIHGDLA